MLPDTYSELYPGRFMRADSLKGAKITLTIAEMDVEELIGENNKKAAKVIAKFARPTAAAFAKLPLELVLPKTNGECLRRMFGNNPHGWVGKRVTLFPSKTKFGPNDVDCIRIWGSPDLDADMEITVPQGRKRALEMVLHAVKGPTAPKPASGLDPRITTAFGVLDWTPKEQALFLNENSHLGAAEMLALLNAKIDAANAVEA